MSTVSPSPVVVKDRPKDVVVGIAGRRSERGMLDKRWTGGISRKYLYLHERGSRFFLENSHSDILLVDSS